MSQRDHLNPSIGGIGKKVEPAPKQTPAIFTPLPHNPDIVRGPDGKLETLIPKNEAVNVPFVFLTDDFDVVDADTEAWGIAVRHLAAD
jgi:hypothetical protein